MAAVLTKEGMEIGLELARITGKRRVRHVMVKRDLRAKLERAKAGVAAGREILACTPFWRRRARREYEDVLLRFEERVICYSLALGLVEPGADDRAMEGITGEFGPGVGAAG
jgi:hypothetical protein